MKYVYLNSRLEPESEARISIYDRGFIYGDGFFETILSVNGRLQFLNEHLERLENSCRDFRINLKSDIDWSQAIGSVLSANGLSERTAAVKIMVSRGESPGSLILDDDTDPTIIITARPYNRISGDKIRDGVKLAVFPEPLSSPLAHHKSMNYLYYLSARDYAVRQGADEAIITDPHGRVLECATANIFLRNKNTVCKPPPGAPYLKGIEERFVISVLKKNGFILEENYFGVDALREAEEVFISNSLIGVLPASGIDDFCFRVDFKAAACLREELLKFQENLTN